MSAEKIHHVLYFLKAGALRISNMIPRGHKTASTTSSIERFQMGFDYSPKGLPYTISMPDICHFSPGAQFLAQFLSPKKRVYLDKIDFA